MKQSTRRSVRSPKPLRQQESRPSVSARCDLGRCGNCDLVADDASVHCADIGRGLAGPNHPGGGGGGGRGGGGFGLGGGAALDANLRIAIPYSRWKLISRTIRP